MTHAYEPEYYRRPDCDKSEANNILSGMEKEAAAKTDGAHKLFAGKWLSVFSVDGVLSYRLEGSWSGPMVPRNVAVSFLARA